MSIDGVISAQVNLNDRRTVGLNTSGNLPVNEITSTTFTDGAGALMGNILYQANLTMTAGAYALDVSGVVTDSYGTTVTAARLKGIYIKNTSTTAISFGAGSTPMTTLLNSTGTLTLPPGAWMVAATPDATGWVVTAATADKINFTGTGAATFKIVILGAST